MVVLGQGRGVTRYSVGARGAVAASGGQAWGQRAEGHVQVTAGVPEVHQHEVVDEQEAVAGAWKPRISSGSSTSR